MHVWAPFSYTSSLSQTLGENYLSHILGVSSYIQHSKVSNTNTLILQDLRWDMHLCRGPTEQKDSSERQDIPVRNTYFASALPFLPGLLTPILSVRSLILLRRCQEERCRSGRQEAQDPPRRSRGQHLILPRYGQTWVKAHSAGCSAQPPLLGWRRMCAHFLCLFFAWPGLLGSDLWLVPLTYSSSGCEPDWKQHNGTSFLSINTMMMKRLRLAIPLKLILITFASRFYWHVSNISEDFGCDLFTGCIVYPSAQKPEKCLVEEEVQETKSKHTKHIFYI